MSEWPTGCRGCRGHIYAKAAEEFGQDRSLTGLEVRLSTLNGVRKVVDKIFSYTHWNTDVTEKFFVRCEMTEEMISS